MEQDILKLFLYREKLRFSQIENSLKERSNKLAYHLKNLLKKKVLVKDGESYKLSRENLIPYLSNKKQVLPVILIHLGNKEKCFLYKREKRPFQGKLSLPGGRMIFGEDIKKATERIMKEKFKVISKFENLCSVSVEHIKGSEKIFQTDLVLFVTAKTKEKIPLTKIKSKKLEIISSDYKLITKDLDKKVETKTFVTHQ